MLVIRDAFEAEDATGDDRRAGCHGFDEYEAEAFLPGVGGAEYVGVLVVGWQFFVGNGAGKNDVVDASLSHHSIGFAVRDAGADDDKAEVGVAPFQSAVCTEEVAKAFAFFADATDEDEVNGVVSEFAGLGSGFFKSWDVDAIRDDGVVVGEVSIGV